MLGLDLSAPDHTTLSRRGQHLDLPLRRAPAGAGLHLLVDSTGLSLVGEGEWAAAKHGGRGRRGWKTRHLGVDRSGVIVARALTEASVDDATTGITLIEAVDGALGRVTADAAYDTISFYEAAGARGATVVVPPTSTAATGTINRETSALHRMGTLAVHWGWLDTVPGFPDRLRENPPRQGFFEHPEYLAVRAHLPAPWQDILDLAYYSGWRKNEILGLTWEEIDEAGGVIRLSPARSKTLVGRILPISHPIAEALARRRARRNPDSPLVFHRDGIPIRRWRTAWRTACQAAGVPTRFLHDCRRTAARNLIRASVPERVAMLLTGHKSRAIFDRYNIINEQELLDAGDQLVAYLAQHAQATSRGRAHPAAPRPAPPLRLVRRTTG